MAFCPNCGASVEGRFCAKCGSAVDTASGAAAPAAGPAYESAAAPQIGAAGMSENVASALCYLLTVITGILFLVLEPYNRNKTVRFHAFQSIFFFVAWIAVWIVVVTVSTILSHIPILGAIVGLLLMMAMSLGGFIVWLLLMWKAFNNQRLVLPIIGPFAEKQA